MPNFYSQSQPLPRRGLAHTPQFAPNATPLIEIEAAPSPRTTDRRAYAYLPVQCFMPTYLSNALNAILRAMNRLLAIAVVACVILFIVAVLIAPTLDLQPSALRAQQWLTLLFSMFSLACLFVICLCTIACRFGTPGSDIQRQQGPSLTDMSCCLLC